MKVIDITDWGNFDSFHLRVQRIGLKYYTNNCYYFEVFDEKLFNYSVIKHEIQFDLLKKL